MKTSNYEIVTIMVTYYSPKDEADSALLAQIQQHSQTFPKLWQQYRAIVTFSAIGNSNCAEYAGTLHYEATNGEGWGAIIEGEQATLETIIEQVILEQRRQFKGSGHPPTGLHLMTLWEVGVTYYPASWVGDEDWSPWWRLLGVIDEHKLPLALDQSSNRFTDNTNPGSTSSPESSAGNSRTSLG